jgi:hypothetical protein
MYSAGAIRAIFVRSACHSAEYFVFPPLFVLDDLMQTFLVEIYDADSNAIGLDRTSCEDWLTRHNIFPNGFWRSSASRNRRA